MGDLLRRFQRESKRLGRQLAPVLDRFRSWNAMKGVVNFRGIELLGVKGQHLGCG